MEPLLLAYGTTAGQITWRRIRAPNYITAATSVTMGTNIHPWVQLKSNPRIADDVKILGAVLEGTLFELGAIKWDGTAFTIIGTSTFTADTTVITYECFELEYVSSRTSYNIESWSTILDLHVNALAHIPNSLSILKRRVSSVEFFS